MSKKKQRPKRFANIVVFPGTTERLIEQGHQYAENYQYDLAIRSIEEALKYTEADESTLSVYAYALYETRAFEKAKVICEQLLAMGPTLYFEVMELYLTICMQLKDFLQAKTLIEMLFEEGAIPEQYLEKFQRLQHLNTDIVENMQLSPMDTDGQSLDASSFELTTFLEQSLQQQIQLLHKLAETNVRYLKEELIKIIEHEQTHPFVQSLVLILFVEQEVNIEILLQKLGQSMKMNPSKLSLPTDLPQYQQIVAIVQKQLEQEPTTLEMVEYLLSKHAIVSYPFEWLSYDVEDVATSYIDYVQAMFGQVKEMDYEIIDFIQMLDQLSDFQEI